MSWTHKGRRDWVSTVQFCWMAFAVLDPKIHRIHRIHRTGAVFPVFILRNKGACGLSLVWFSYFASASAGPQQGLRRLGTAWALELLELSWTLRKFHDGSSWLMTQWLFSLFSVYSCISWKFSNHKARKAPSRSTFHIHQGVFMGILHLPKSSKVQVWIAVPICSLGDARDFCDKFNLTVTMCYHPLPLYQLYQQLSMFVSAYYVLEWS